MDQNSDTTPKNKSFNKRKESGTSMNSFKLEPSAAKKNLDDFGSLGIVLEN